MVELIDLARFDDFAKIRLLESVEPYMFGVARRFFRLNNDDINDVIQESRIAIYESLNKFSGDLSMFRHWVAGIVSNKCLNYKRKKIRRQRNEQEAGNQMKKVYTPDNKNDIQEDIQNVFNKLSENEKYIVKRHYFDNQSYEQIANELNENANNIRSKIFRKFNKIKNKVS